MSIGLAEKSPQKAEVRTIVADGLMTVSEAAEYLSISRSKLYVMMDDGELAYVDAQLARLLERLRNDPAWERTLVVIAGDHGEGLYDHGERYHSVLVYESTQHVPLILRAPGAGPAASARAISGDDGEEYCK